MKELFIIQQKLKCDKSLRNDYGKYNYRSAEQILEAVKPILADQKCVLILNDDIVERSGCNYVKATATLYREDGTECAHSTAYAQDEGKRSGMDAAQVTGAASSYARKYALNGLFAIDNTKDVDTEEYQNKKQAASKAKASAAAAENTRLQTALAEVAKCKDRDSLNAVWNTFADLQNVAEFKQAVIAANKF